MTAVSLHLQRWQSLEPKQREQVLALHISSEQLEFAGPIERAVAACESAPTEYVAGLAIIKEERVVGFLVLSRGANQASWAPEGAVALTAMRIDSSQQGRGIGKVALQSVTEWLSLHWPTSATLALVVDEENMAGRQAYESSGFTEYAEPAPGRIGMVRYLSMQLHSKRRAA